MFNSEFGRIGEATLAVLHGWLPRTKLFNDGYKFDPRVYGLESRPVNSKYAYDIVLLGLFNAFISGDLSQLLSDAIEKKEIDEDTPHSFDSANVKELFFNFYKKQVSLEERVNLNKTVPVSAAAAEVSTAFDFLDDHFEAIRYNVSSRPESYKSLLLNSVNYISKNYPRPDDISNISNDAYSESLERMYEPDPLINPDPFIISEEKIGYFSKTDFTLENLPPLTDSEAYIQTMKDLEDKALTEILKFYGKPEIFYLDTRNEE